MRTTARRIALAGAAVAATLAVAAPAQALPPLVNVSCGQTITTSIRMNNDLVGCTGDGLVIGANGVSIDMNFHTITGDNTPAIANGAAADNGIENNGFDNTEVKNGTIRNFNWSVGNFNQVNNSRVYNVRSSAARNDALFNHGSGNTIDFNEITIGIDGVLQTAGVHAEGNNNTVTRNTINGGWYGVALGASNTLVDRNQTRGSHFGIAIGGAANTIVSRNRTEGGHIGFWVQGFGLNVDYDENEALRAGSDGFRLADMDAASLLSDNEARDNGDDGIEIGDNTSFGVSIAPTLTGNEVHDNGDWGIEAPPTVVDGGGNDGSGNGQPAQCQNVSC